MRRDVGFAPVRWYRAELAERFERAVALADRILRGAKLACCGVASSPRACKVAINVKTAQARGLQIPQSVIARAGIVIECSRADGGFMARSRTMSFTHRV